MLYFLLNFVSLASISIILLRAKFEKTLIKTSKTFTCSCTIFKWNKTSQLTVQSVFWCKQGLLFYNPKLSVIKEVDKWSWDLVYLQLVIWWWQLVSNEAWIPQLVTKCGWSVKIRLTQDEDVFVLILLDEGQTYLLESQYGSLPLTICLLITMNMT